jgi:biopolymer transport protein ExbD
MRLRRPEIRTPPETIVALIDVVFFLLVFFLLIGRFDATAPFRVDPPRGATGADMQGGDAVVSVSRSGETALDGVAMAEAELLVRLGELGAGRPDLRVRLNADGEAELRHVLPLAARLYEQGIGNVDLIVTPGGP